MAYLVGNHVRLGKVSRRSEPSVEFFEERKVDVHQAVSRTVEGADCRRSRTARGTHSAAKQHYFGSFILLIRPSEHPRPAILYIRHHVFDEHARGVIGTAHLRISARWGRTR